MDPKPETVSYLEYRADFRVELRFDEGRAPRTIPFLQLPISRLPADFFPLTCKTCVDCTNRLADITVGYMGGDGDQWVIVRNDRGAELYQRPFQLTCAQARVAMEAMALGSLARKFQALQQASTMSS